MARDYLQAASLAWILLALAGQARGEEGSPVEPSLSLQPGRVRPGDAFAVLAAGVGAPPRGEVAGRALQFFPVEGGFLALAGLPVESAPGSLRVEVVVPGRADPLAAALEVVEPGFSEAELAVEQRFITPSREARHRMWRDQAAFSRAFDQPFEPPLFGAPFAWPRQDEVTGRFGDKRLLNGRKHSQHYGVDLAGEVGDAVAAANDGRVVLVRDCYASGKSVVVWHGAGLFTVYFHLSRFAVKAGSRVQRGDPIGRVGKSGRVTGPHLHWGTKLGDLYVDPESVLRLPLGRGASAAESGR